MRVLALDYGAARTGVAISDETGTIARPVTVVERVGSEAGLARLVELIAAERPERIVLGLPTPLAGGDNAQSRAVRAFRARLTAAVDVPVDFYDERLTTALAERRGGRAALDARAAAQILEDYLRAHE